jgi:leader peptidase (prepilin peptidase)/N-methyltransferase
VNAPIVGPFVPALPAVLLCLLLAGAGLGAGAAARRLLARLRRGARVPRPWCELGVAVAWGTTGAVAAVGAGSGGAALRLLPVLLGLGWLAVAASAVDVLHRRLPDALTLPALPVALLLLAPLGAAAVLRGLVAAALWAAAYGAVHLAAPAALGAGDVKLAAPLAAVLGAVSWEAVAVGAVLAAVLSVAAAAAVAVRAGGAAGLRSMALPHGPAMLLAAWLVVTAAAGARGP